VPAITIEHHKTATASCRDCDTSWAAGDWTTVPAVLAQAAEHAIGRGHTVAEHVADDAVVHPHDNNDAGLREG
jgi:hypothetical protein